MNTNTTITTPPGPSAGQTRKKSKRGPRPKHVPQRTCIACRTAAPKRSFVRVVRTPTGAVMIDPTGKKSGRGASICDTRSCWTRALANGVLERALRIEIGADDRAALDAYVARLPEADAATSSVAAGVSSPATD